MIPDSKVTLGRWGWLLPSQHSGGQGRKGAAGLRPVWASYLIPSQPRLRKETLFQKSKEKSPSQYTIKKLTRVRCENIPALGRLRQEAHENKVNQGCIMSQDRRMERREREKERERRGE